VYELGLSFSERKNYSTEQTNGTDDFFRQKSVCFKGTEDFIILFQIIPRKIERGRMTSKSQDNPIITRWLAAAFGDGMPI
jgi:hypothetical protein